VSNSYSVLLGQKHANWTEGVPVSGEKYLGYHHERNKFKNGFVPSKNYTERHRFISKNNVLENSRYGSYARTSNYGVSQNERCGNWGSSKYVPSRQNEERCDPGTNHYTMAWIKDQNRHLNEPYTSLPQMFSPFNHMPSYLQTVTTEENEMANPKPSNQSNICKFEMSSGYESLPYMPTDCSQPAPTFNTASLLLEQAPAKDYLNRMSSTLPRPPKNKSITKIQNYQSFDTDTADVKPERGRKSIIQNPCYSSTYHHITSVARTLPRQSKKLPRGHSSGTTETDRIQSVNKYFGCKGEKISRVRALVESFENSAICKDYTSRNQVFKSKHMEDDIHLESTKNEKIKVPPKVAPKPDKKEFQLIDNVSNNNLNPGNTTALDDLSSEPAECDKYKSVDMNVKSRSEDVKRSEDKLCDIEVFHQTSDSCSSSGVYSIIDQNKIVESEKHFPHNSCDDDNDDKEKSSVDEADIRDTGVKEQKLSEEAFLGTRNSFSDQYEAICIGEYEKATYSLDHLSGGKTDPNNFKQKSRIDKLKEKHGEMQRMLGDMYTKEDQLQEEIQYTSTQFKIIELKLVEVARMYEVDKFKLHILEIEKIMALILGLKHRLEQVECSLNSFEWNGVDERFDLERKREKLINQLDEAKELWTFIDRRTGVVAGYIEHNLSYQTVIQFRQLVKNKVNQMVEIRTLKNSIAVLLDKIK